MIDFLSLFKSHNFFHDSRNFPSFFLLSFNYPSLFLFFFFKALRQKLIGEGGVIDFLSLKAITFFTILEIFFLLISLFLFFLLQRDFLSLFKSHNFFHSILEIFFLSFNYPSLFLFFFFLESPSSKVGWLVRGGEGGSIDFLSLFKR